MCSYSRFTGAVARQAKSVLAVDFMEKFLTENKERNKNYNNIEYLPADVTKLDRPTERYLFIFTHLFTKQQFCMSMSIHFVLIIITQQ